MKELVFALHLVGGEPIPDFLQKFCEERREQGQTCVVQRLEEPDSRPEPKPQCETLRGVRFCNV